MDNGGLHREIVYSEELEGINSPAFYNCIIHLICTDGHGTFTYNGRRFALRTNDIAVISQPRMVGEIAKDASFSCRYIVAPERFLHNLLPANNYSIQGRVSLFDNPIIHVDAQDSRRFRHDLDNIRTRMTDTAHLFYTDMIAGLLRTMVYDLFDFHAKHNENVLTTDRVGYITSQFFTLIEGGLPKTEREVAYYARRLNVTPKYLAQTIKRATGASVSSHITHAATAIIISMLDDSRLSVTQIADEMHFASVSYFSRYCSKHLGISPAQYRTAGASTPEP
ncbi:MAG: helix-turn-helix transcriptional regulator [Paramuribaculum sp.]|nr:helix-turn-helix transcriptional regulator [Paramuribaculum sp.]